MLLSRCGRWLPHRERGGPHGVGPGWAVLACWPVQKRCQALWAKPFRPHGVGLWGVSISLCSGSRIWFHASSSPSRKREVCHPPKVISLCSSSDTARNTAKVRSAPGIGSHPPEVQEGETHEIIDLEQSHCACLLNTFF